MTLPESERAAYAQELNALKSGDARARQLQAQSARFEQVAQAAEDNAIQAVRYGADPFATARNLSLAVGQEINVADLIRAAEESGGIVGAQRITHEGGQQAPATQPGLRPGGEAPAGPNVRAPMDVDTVWPLHRAQADLNHPQSWTKPLLTARREAQQQRDLANAALAQATIDGTPQAQAQAQKLAEGYNAAADKIEAQAEFARDQRTAGIIRQSEKFIMSKLQPLLDKLEEVGQKDAATRAITAEWGGVAQSMRAAREPNGAATFGPDGYGILQVDENGNCTIPTPQGQKVLDQAEQIMLKHNMPRTMSSMRLALDVLASEWAFSEGAGSSPAGGQGGSDMLPSGGSTPGNGALRPSPAGAPRGDSMLQF
jgi:hypothetical protein